MSVFHGSAIAGNPEMEKAFKLPTNAKELLHSKNGGRPDVLPLVEAAKQAIKKSPYSGIYRGHRMKAMEESDNAIAGLKTGGRANKAIEYITRSIGQIHVGGGLSK